jgi:hypothetical protein
LPDFLSQKRTVLPLERDSHFPERKHHAKERFLHAYFRENQPPYPAFYPLKRLNHPTERNPNGQERENPDNERIKEIRVFNINSNSYVSNSIVF